MKYYSLDNILKHEAQYYIIYGSRSNGKSYACDKYVIDKFFKSGEEFVILKRYQDDIKKTIAETMLTPLYDYVLENYNHYIRFYNGKWLCSEDVDLPINKWKIMGYAISLNNTNRTKGSQYPKVTSIIFEEFMSIGGDYLTDEINLLLNTVSTIARKRINVKIFMLANAISKWSPYSDALGVNLAKIKQGEIIETEIKGKDGITKFAIERSRNVKIDKNENPNNVSYNNFGKVKSSMISDGEFEHRKYPRIREGVYFNENRKELLKEGHTLSKKGYFKANERTNIIIEYNEVYYDIFIRMGKYPILGIKEKELQKVTNRNIAVINPSRDYSDILLIYNFSTVDTHSPQLNNLLNLIARSFLNNYVVFISDEVGEDVTTAMNLVWKK